MSDNRIYYKSDILVSSTRGMIHDVIQKRFGERENRTYKCWINSFREMKDGKKIAFAFLDIHDDTQPSTSGWMHYHYPIKWDEPISPEELIETFAKYIEDFEKPLEEREFRVPNYGYSDDEAPYEYAPR